MFGWKMAALKGNFFDRDKVLRSVAAGERRVLSKFGAFVRQRAKTSIRRRKAVSDPGEPPSSHQGDLRGKILFAYEPERHSVVIGPAAFGAGEAPRLLEHGGDIVRNKQHMHYRPRPFMGPALEEERPKLPAMWANSVR